MKQSAKSLDAPFVRRRARRKHIVKNQVGSSWSRGRHLLELAGHQHPTQTRMHRRLPLAGRQQSGWRLMMKIGKITAMSDRQPKRIKVVFKANDLQGTQRAGPGQLLITLNSRHGVGGRTQSHIPDNQWLNAGFNQAPSQVRLPDIEAPRLLNGRRHRMHDLTRGPVTNTGKPRRRGVNLVGPKSRTRRRPNRRRPHTGVINVLNPEERPHGLVKGQKPVIKNALTDLPHQALIKMQVMLTHQIPSQRLVGLGQVVQVSPGIFLAGRTWTGRIRRLLTEFIDRAPKLQQPSRGENRPALGQLRWNDAVKHVHAPVHGFKKIKRRAHPHQISRPIRRQQRRRIRTHIFALALGLAHSQPTNSKTVKWQLHQPLRTLAPQVRKKRPLHDRKKRRQRVPARLQTPHRPALGDFQRRPRLRFARRRGNTLVQHHHDVTANRKLRLDTQFRTEQNTATIHITLKNSTLLTHGSRMRKRENLIPPRVGQYRPVPPHKPVNAATALKNLRPRPQQ